LKSLEKYPFLQRFCSGGRRRCHRSPDQPALMALRPIFSRPFETARAALTASR
jgi:hypothetical protein